MTDDDEINITWIPSYTEYPFWRSTFGTANHNGTGYGVHVPETGCLIDTDIAELVALINKAGIQTVQSCDDIGDVPAQIESDWLPDDTPRMCVVVVKWDDFPKLHAMLPRLDEQSGWLFAVDMNGTDSHGLHIDVLFPHADIRSWTARLVELANGS